MYVTARGTGDVDVLRILVTFSEDQKRGTITA
jgi:hypothetical protein